MNKKLTKKQRKIYDFLISKPGYLKKGITSIGAVLLNNNLGFYPIKDIDKALKQARIDYKKSLDEDLTYSDKSIKTVEIKSLGDIFPWVNDKPESKKIYKEKFDKSNVLVIGDTHFPFEKEGYLDFCLDMQKKYKAGTVIHIGDVADNCYSSFHDNNPDGLAAGDELKYAIESAKDWGKAFPNVKVTLGNHCQIIQRKAFASGVSSKWIKGLSEVLELPGWQFEMEHEIDGVLYTHGTGTSGDKAAYNKSLHRRKSIVQGHLHSQASIMWNTSNIDKIFAMQVGCGVDETKYAFDYAKNFPKKFIVSCGLVLENGTLPVLELMKL